MDFCTFRADSRPVHEPELAARLQALVEELRRTTRTAEELTATVADAIRRERKAGLPFVNRPGESSRQAAASGTKR
jgi:hypothetical protein